MEKYLSHFEDYTVAVDEVDFLERLKPSAVMQYFQDLATVHAEILGIGFQRMLEKNLIWVMTKMSVRFFRYPKIGEKIKVVTFPRKPHMVDVGRDYYILDKNDNIVVGGTSKWVVIDVNSHMIRRCAPIFEYSDDMYMPDDPFDDANRALSDISEFEYTELMTDTVRISDLDRNKHMNNARYGDIILNAFEKEWLENHSIARFDVNFLHEMKYADKYDVFGITSNNISSIRTERNGSAVFRAQIEWNND